MARRMTNDELYAALEAVAPKRRGRPKKVSLTPGEPVKRKRATKAEVQARPIDDRPTWVKKKESTKVNRLKKLRDDLIDADIPEDKWNEYAEMSLWIAQDLLLHMVSSRLMSLHQENPKLYEEIKARRKARQDAQIAFAGMTWGQIDAERAARKKVESKADALCACCRPEAVHDHNGGPIYDPDLPWYACHPGHCDEVHAEMRERYAEDEYRELKASSKYRRRAY